MDGLFDEQEKQQEEQGRPLAERMRPRTLDDVVGQRHLLGKGAPLRVFVERGTVPSMILWGPPGTGKTTLASAIAHTAGLSMERMSAVESGVKDLRAVIDKATRMVRRGERSLLFIDEIHRFNKSQQDALLHAVERGIITLIGATTENPSFEVNAALLSRCQVYRLQALTDEDITTILQRALAQDDVLRTMNIVIDDEEALVSMAAGDARTALNALEAAASMADVDSNRERHLTRELLRNTVQRRILKYDRAGDAHYDTISAFIKSMRGSDPDAALYYLAIMIDAGEDPLFIARRLVIFASEDVGNADVRGLPLAIATFQALERIGMPEGRIPLAQCTTFLASAPKSNASYVAIDAALARIQEGGDVVVPLHLRNSPTRLMKEMGYGKEYRYPHSFDGHFVPDENYFPDGVQGSRFYEPGDEGDEAELKDRLKSWWPDRWKK